VAVLRLTDAAKMTQVAFCGQELDRDDGLPIIVSDESMVSQDLNLGGICWKRGEILEEGFCVEHGLGAIGIGFLGRLVKCPPARNQQSYRQMLIDSRVFERLVSLRGSCPSSGSGVSDGSKTTLRRINPSAENLRRCIAS
jgi:hypothetical protein